MATRRKKPDATDTEPPEEARPDTTATPLLVEDGKLLPPEVVFTAEKLLRWLEGLAEKHNKGKMHDNAWSYVQACKEQDVTTGKEILEMPESWLAEEGFLLPHMAIIRAAIGNEEVTTPAKANRFANPAGMSTPATSTMSGGSADSAMLSVLTEIVKESRESMATMQRSHEKAAADQAKAAADLSLKAIQAVSTSNAKIAVQPATLNCGANGLSPSPADVFAFLEDIKTRYNAIFNGIRAFIVRILRDPTGSVMDFQAGLNEDERKALYVCINEKIPRALLRTIWDTSDLDGAGLLHALLQHAINPGDKSVELKRATKFFVDTGAMTKHQNFQGDGPLELNQLN